MWPRFRRSRALTTGRRRMRSRRKRRTRKREYRQESQIWEGCLSDQQGALRKVVWTPLPGPQTAFVQCPISDVFYGGARGGGKTFGLLGDFLGFSAKYRDLARGILFRRTLSELEEVIR